MRPTSGTIYIAPDGSGDYPTIQEAIDAVVPGSTIVLGAGTYQESIYVTKSLSLLGARVDLVEITAMPYSDAAVFSGGGDFVVEDITFRGGVVVVKDGQIAFAQCRFRNTDGTGLLLRGTTTGVVRNCEAVENDAGIILEDHAQLTLEGNVFSDNRGDGGGVGLFYLNSAGGVARGNECSRNGGAGILVYGEAQPTLEGNVANNNSYGILYGDNAGGVARQNECSANRSNGIDVNDYAAPRLEGNTCSHNEQFGIGVFDRAEPYLVNNHCYDNGVADILDWRE